MNPRTPHHAAALGLAATFWWLAPARSEPAAQQRTAVDGYRVVHSYPHDPDAYTQGLIYRDGFLF